MLGTPVTAFQVSTEFPPKHGPTYHVSTKPAPSSFIEVWTVRLWSRDWGVIDRIADVRALTSIAYASMSRETRFSGVQ